MCNAHNHSPLNVDALTVRECTQHVQRLLNSEKDGVLNARLAKMGLGGSVECKRCGGDGKYWGGRVCYGCNGLGRVNFKYDRQTVRELLAAETDGTLAKWHYVWQVMGIEARADKQLSAQWTNTGISDRYDWSKAVTIKQQLEQGLNVETYHLDVSEINRVMSDAVQELVKFEGRHAFRKLTDVDAAVEWSQGFMRAFENVQQVIRETEQDLHDYLAEQPTVWVRPTR